MLDGWTRTTVEEICEQVSVGIVIQPAQYYVSQGQGVRAFRSANVGENRIVDGDWVYLSREGHRLNSKSELRAGDVLVVRSGAPGTACVVTPEYAGCNCIDIVFARPNQSKVLPHFLAEYTNSPEGRRHVLGNQGGLALKHFNVGAYKKLEILLPSLAEQRKIVEILRRWDQAIELSERLRHAKQSALCAARQKVFGRDGMPRSKWPSAALLQIVERVRRQSDGQDHPVMTISGKFGFLRQDDKFDRFMAGESVDRYLLLKRGEFAYNKGNSKTYPQGCIYRLEQDTALVPFVYFAFALRNDLNSDFYGHLFEAGFLNHQLARLINSGVRNDGLLNLHADDFFSCVVPVPPRAEQDRLAEFFNLTKRELTGLDRKIDALKRQKRGLMQNLLTGRWRVGEAVKEAAE